MIFERGGTDEGVTVVENGNEKVFDYRIVKIG